MAEKKIHPWVIIGKGGSATAGPEGTQEKPKKETKADKKGGSK